MNPWMYLNISTFESALLAINKNKNQKNYSGLLYNGIVNLLLRLSEYVQVESSRIILTGDSGVLKKY